MATLHLPQVPARPFSRQGFTLVELLVVIAIMTGLDLLYQGI